MKTSLKLFATLTCMSLALILSSCKGDAKKELDKAADEVVETTKDAAETVGEAAEDAVDATGEAIENAADAVENAAKNTADAVNDEIKRIAVKFDAGSSSKTIESSIKGYETHDYTLNVKKGQALNISMASESGSPYFNILEPGETNVAIYNGSINGNQYEGVTKKSGDYTVRVYMMRSAARRNETAKFRLELIAD